MVFIGNVREGSRCSRTFWKFGGLPARAGESRPSSIGQGSARRRLVSHFHRFSGCNSTLPLSNRPVTTKASSGVVSSSSPQHPQ